MGEVKLKKKIIFLLMSICFLMTSIPVQASEQPTVSVEQTEGMTVKTTTYDDYQVVKVTDEEGNSAVCDSRNDYVEENGEKIHFSVETVADIEPVDEGKFAVGIEPYALSDWKKIRSYTYTIEFEDKISNLTISAITSLIKVKYIMYVGAASSIASMVKAAYKKPDLKGKKAFYAKNTVYGYTYQSGREATKRIALDAKKRTIKGTETYSDVAIKGK